LYNIELKFNYNTKNLSGKQSKNVFGKILLYVNVFVRGHLIANQSLTFFYNGLQ